MFRQKIRSGVMFVLSAVAFIGGLALAYRWVNQPYCPPAKTPTAKVPHASSQD